MATKTAIEIIKLAAVGSGIQTSLDNIDSGLANYGLARLNSIARRIWQSHAWRNYKSPVLSVVATAADVVFPSTVSVIRSISIDGRPVPSYDEVGSSRKGLSAADGIPRFYALPDTVSGARSIRLSGISEFPVTLTVHAVARFVSLGMSDRFPVESAEGALVEFMTAEFLDYQDRRTEAAAKRAEASEALLLAVKEEDDTEDKDNKTFVPETGSGW